MQDKDLFEYAVVRVVPRVEREEFINVGVVLYCSKQKFLGVLFELNAEKLAVFCKETDTDVLKANFYAFERICMGIEGSGPIGELDIASRFRWLTATRSTVLQTSKVHAGFCVDAMDKMKTIFNEMVL